MCFQSCQTQTTYPLRAGSLASYSWLNMHPSSTWYSPLRESDQLVFTSLLKQLYPGTITQLAQATPFMRYVANLPKGKP